MRSKRAIKNVMTSLLQQIIIVICGLIVPRTIIMTFGSNVNGLISSITQFLSYITLLEIGIGPVIKSSLYKPIAKKNKNQIEKILKASERFFKIISGIFLIYIFILCLIYPNFVAQEFDKKFTISLIIIIAISNFAQYYFGMVYRLYLQAEQKTYITSYIQIFVTIINTISIVCLIKIGANIQIVKLASSLIFVLNPILLNIYVKRKYNINLKKVKESYDLKQKWDGLAQHIASVIHSNTDIVILTLCTNIAEVSVYSVYMLVINALKNLIQPLKDSVDAIFGDMIAKEEIENLNIKFKVYEFFYFTLITIIYVITIIMIVPFVNVYTLGILDVNYNRPLFAFIIVLAEFMWAVRLPYSGLSLAAGHFKETKKGAWAEAFINLFLSIVLVFYLGIIGVAIGTLIAMILRTIEFMYHSSKYILKRDLKYNAKVLIIIIVELVILIPIGSYINSFMVINNYSTWILSAIIISSIAVLIILLINSFCYNNEVKLLIEIIKNIGRKKVK